jgi:hypothetical protein
MVSRAALGRTITFIRIGRDRPGAPQRGQTLSAFWAWLTDSAARQGVAICDTFAARRRLIRRRNLRPLMMTNATPEFSLPSNRNDKRYVKTSRSVAFCGHSRPSERPRTTFWWATKVLPRERKSDTPKIRILRFF